MANVIAIFFGSIELFSLESSILHIVFVCFASLALGSSILYDSKNLIRPQFFFVLSFFVFVWMRILLNIFFDTEVITTGNGITTANINRTSIYLGITMCFMCCVATVVGELLKRSKLKLLEGAPHIVIAPIFEKILILIAIVLFCIFLLDSYKKIGIINSHDYLMVSENIMLEGYKYFTFGKWVIILWILIGKDKNRFFIGSTILAVAAIGYLMRGARGYAICYIFMWLLFCAIKHRIKFTSLVLIGLGLIFLADFILSYRLGWSVASGFWNKIISTLNSQGASIENVFGSVVFKDELKQVFSIADIFSRSDYGNVVDRVRGTGFSMGGFGSSFFAEAFFIGFPIGFLFIILLATCVGTMEYAYQVIKRDESKANYAQILLFMTTPNLIYFGRSSMYDYIFKSIATIVIILFLQTIAKPR